MNKNIKYPHYIRALSAYHQGDRRTFERLRKNSKLSQFEKKMLKTRSLYSKDKWEEAREIIDSISEVNCAFLNGDLNTVKAYVYAHLNMRSKAIHYVRKGVSFFKEFDEKKGIFNSLFNLSIYYYQEGQIKKALEKINEASAWAISPWEFSDIHRHKASLFLANHDHINASNEIEKAFEYFSKLNLTEQGNLYTYAAEFFFSLGRLDKCREYLKIVKSNKLNKHKDWAFMQLKLLDVYESGKHLKRIPIAISNSKKFSLMWVIIKYIQDGDHEEATSHWDKLIEDMPDTYGADYTVINHLDENNIFYQTIKSLTKEDNIIIGNFGDLKIPPNSKLARLFQLLLNSKYPLRKEELIEKIWNTEYNPNLDNNFYQLVKTLKEKYNAPIVNRNRTYKLIA